MTKATRPFVIGPRLTNLRGAYPQAQDILEAATEGRRAKAILARLWISEGIPFAFKDCPSLYEEFRALLAGRLNIDAKQISIAGSGRLGYSLAPSKWGDTYRPDESDLDLFAVSNRLFEQLCEDFIHWRDDYHGGEVIPKNERERYYWDINREETPDSIRRGFVDSFRVPNMTSYITFRTMNRCLEFLRVNLRTVDGAPKPSRRLSLRCYRDWPAYERQMDISLKKVVDMRLGTKRQTV